MIAMYPIADRKLAIAFDQFDPTGNGTITREDILCVGNQLLSAFGENVGTVKGTNLIDAMIVFWSRLCTVSSEHGDLDEEQAAFTEQEFITAMKAAFLDAPGEFAHFAAPMYTAMFEICDYDDDGLIGREEFTALQVVLGSPIATLAEAFARLDHDHDGRLTLEQLERHAYDFYASSRDATPGIHLFGVLSWE